MWRLACAVLCLSFPAKAGDFKVAVRAEPKVKLEFDVTVVWEVPLSVQKAVSEKVRALVDDFSGKHPEIVLERFSLILRMPRFYDGHVQHFRNSDEWEKFKREEHTGDFLTVDVKLSGRSSRGELKEVTGQATVPYNFRVKCVTDRELTSYRHDRVLGDIPVHYLYYTYRIDQHSVKLPRWCEDLQNSVGVDKTMYFPKDFDRVIETLLGDAAAAAKR